MPAPHPLYRLLTHLYPQTFRRHYGDDLVQHFADLVSDRGARAAWTRTGLDAWTVRETVLAIIGNVAMIGAIGYLVPGLLTPKTPDQRSLAPAP